ncbi:MAG TPA: NnrS family protein [Woeseiaceae bacterium]|nr:NnrS family protein [Woeseiaceae bacterium]
MARLIPFAYGFRPFFLAAGWHAPVAIGVWLWLYRAGLAPFDTLPAHQWHAHEMLFGFVAAAMAGFMLTAVPSWTGGRGFAGPPLIVLAALWLVGRVAMAAAGVLPFWLVAPTELAFLPALAATIAPSLLKSSSRNAPLLVVLFALWLSDATFVRALHDGDVALASTAIRAALDVVLLLVTIIGGRIVPAFTAAALRRRGAEFRVRTHPAVEALAIGGMIALIVADLVAPGHGLTAAVVFVAALAHAARIAGWQTARTLAEPIVWVLHAAYGWLPIGLLLKSVWLVTGAGWAAHWPHALGAGAAATMILAVMTRASLGHTGRPLVVAKAIALAYALLIAAVVVRVFGPALLPLAYTTNIALAAILWISAFLIYAIVYTPILLGPRTDGKPG